MQNVRIWHLLIVIYSQDSKITHWHLLTALFLLIACSFLYFLDSCESAAIFVMNTKILSLLSIFLLLLLTAHCNFCSMFTLKFYFSLISIFFSRDNLYLLKYSAKLSVFLLSWTPKSSITKGLDLYFGSWNKTCGCTFLSSRWSKHLLSVLTVIVWILTWVFRGVDFEIEFLLI